MMKLTYYYKVDSALISNGTLAWDLSVRHWEMIIFWTSICGSDNSLAGLN